MSLTEQDLERRLTRQEWFWFRIGLGLGFSLGGLFVVLIQL